MCVVGVRTDRRSVTVSVVFGSSEARLFLSEAARWEAVDTWDREPYRLLSNLVSSADERG